MLVPGGKAFILVLNLSNLAFQTLSLTTGADKVAVKEKIDQALKDLLNFPSQFQLLMKFYVLALLKISMGQYSWLKMYIS